MSTNQSAVTKDSKAYKKSKKKFRKNVLAMDYTKSVDDEKENEKINKKVDSFHKEIKKKR